MQITFTFRKWHSIGLIPVISAVSVVSGENFYPIVRSYEISWLGVIFEISVPSDKQKNGWMIGGYGLTWSRRKKRWYWIPKP